MTAKEQAQEMYNENYSIIFQHGEDLAEELLISVLAKIFTHNQISAIIHSINTFCHCFPYEYNDLNIFVCLDKNCRIIEQINSELDFDEIFDIQKKKLVRV